MMKRIYVSLVVFFVVLIICISGCVKQETTPQPKHLDKHTKEVTSTTTETTTSTTNAEEVDIENTSKTKEVQILRGTVDPDLEVDIYDSDKAWRGTTLLLDHHDSPQSRIIEVNMLGEIVWEYMLPEDLREYTNPGPDVELLANNNVLFVAPGKGVYEINRNGTTVWSYENPKVSHDADRLANGNTLIAFGNNDRKTDAQLKEIDSTGKIVWSWHAGDYFGDKEPYSSIDIESTEGWTHTNAVSRLKNGNTLISPRNFHMLVEVSPQGEVVKTICEGLCRNQHDPEVQANGNILFANHDKPHEAIELNPETDEILWRFKIREQKYTPVRDANRLPNGNTLITGSTTVLEVTPDKEVVWRLTLKDTAFTLQESAGRGFYKAERIGQ